MFLFIGALGECQRLSAAVPWPLDDLKNKFTELSCKLDDLAEILDYTVVGKDEDKLLRMLIDNDVFKSSSSNERIKEISSIGKNLGEVKNKLLFRFGKIKAGIDAASFYRGLSCSAAQDQLWRIIFILRQLDDIVAMFTDKNKELVYTSFGAGGLLQTYMTVFALSELGYKKIVVNAIDKNYDKNDTGGYSGKRYVDAFKLLTQNRGITIHTFDDTEEYLAKIEKGQAKKSHCIESVRATYEISGGNIGFSYKQNNDVKFFISSGVSQYGDLDRSNTVHQTVFKQELISQKYNLVSVGSRRGSRFKLFFQNGVCKKIVGRKDYDKTQINGLINKKLSDVVDELLKARDTYEDVVGEVKGPIVKAELLVKIYNAAFIDFYDLLEKGLENTHSIYVRDTFGIERSGETTGNIASADEWFKMGDLFESNLIHL